MIYSFIHSLINQSFIQSINQSVNQSIIQSISQSLFHRFTNQEVKRKEAYIPERQHPAYDCRFFVGLINYLYDTHFYLLLTNSLSNWWPSIAILPIHC